MKKIVLYLICTLFGYYNSNACSCGCISSIAPLDELGLSLNNVNKIQPTAIIDATLTHYEENSDSNRPKWKLYFVPNQVYQGSIKREDTLVVYTGNNDGGCGFTTTLNTSSILTIYQQNDGYLETYSSECSWSTSSDLEPNRYYQVKAILDALFYNKKDSTYTFSHYEHQYHCDNDTNKIGLSFSMTNGMLNGEWRRNDLGSYVEIGYYKKGKKHGKWQSSSTEQSNTSYYHHGILKRKRIETIEYNWELYDDSKHILPKKKVITKSTKRRTTQIIIDYDIEGKRCGRKREVTLE